jgi:hypothetical protein
VSKWSIEFFRQLEQIFQPHRAIFKEFTEKKAQLTITMFLQSKETPASENEPVAK